MQSDKIYIVGNWKMHGDVAMAGTVADAACAQAETMPASVEVVLCPPAPLIPEVARRVFGSRVRVGGQDCHEQSGGAYTGDISAGMLREAGCTYVIVGHSERRGGHGETSAHVRAKALSAITNKLVPIICVGETLAQREAGEAEAVVEEQLRESIPKEAGEGQFLLAYEPVWAIGTGKTPALSDIKQMHIHVISIAAAKTGLAPEQISVLYGGSVNAANAREILAMEGVSGVLVGGASLKAEEFCKIIAAAS